jgi:hypothetical protein
MNKEYITTLMILWVLLDFENLILDFSIFGCWYEKGNGDGFQHSLCLIVGMF